MGKITIEEFMKLSTEEKCKRHNDLSDADKFLARMTDQALGGTEITGTFEMTEEDKKDLEKMEKEMDKHISKLKEMRKEKEK